MPDKKGRKTPQEERWIAHMAATGDPLYAAHKAGYSTPRTAASHNMHKPDLLAAVAEESNLMALDAAGMRRKGVELLTSMMDRMTARELVAATDLAHKIAESLRAKMEEETGRKSVSELDRDILAMVDVIRAEAVDVPVETATTNTTANGCLD